MTRKKRSKEGRKRRLKPQDEAPTEEGFQAQRAAEREDNPRGRSKEARGIPKKPSPFLCTQKDTKTAPDKKRVIYHRLYGWMLP